MILCIDVGNSVIHLGIFDDAELILQFSYNSKDTMSSDEFGIFIKNILLENHLNWQLIKNIIICSVVPELNYPIRSACAKYFKIEPLYLRGDANTGLKIRYTNPSEVGADRIATAIGAIELFPENNLLVVDMGTATTLCAITKNKEYLGGAILPGLTTSAKALHSNTAKLSTVEIAKPDLRLGNNTKENIQIGLFYGQLGSIREIIAYLSEHAFKDEQFKVIGTGGLCKLFKNEDLFDQIIAELALKGLKKFYSLSK
jgi:type III pantothenate kinase